MKPRAVIMAKAQVKNWKEFQHYKDRSPPWLKLHKTLLDDFSFQMLPIASKALAPMLWLLASENNAGEVDIDLDFLSFRLRWPKSDIQSGLSPLIDKGFLIVASDVLAECLQDACLEGERETEAERDGKEEAVTKRKSDASPIGSRLPNDWRLPDDWKEWAIKERPDVNPVSEARTFADYWISVAGAKGRKADWQATWRNWIRRANSTNGNRSNGAYHAEQPRRRNEL